MSSGLVWPPQGRDALVFSGSSHPQLAAAVAAKLNMPLADCEIGTFADGEIAIEVEALEMRLEDVTRPYVAPSGKAPDHFAD